MKEVSERERDLPTALIGKLLKIASERKDIISLSVGEPDFDAPKPIFKAVEKVARNYKKNRLSHYTAPAGITELRVALAQKLKKDNKIKVSPDNILVTAGSQEALFAGFLSTLDPTEEVIVQNPGYLGYIPSIELCSGVPHHVEVTQENNFEIDPDTIARAANKKSRVILLNTPSNPTGTVIRKKILEEVCDIAVEKDLYIFADEAYEKLVYGDNKHVSIGSLNGMNKYVATFQTFSKSYAMCGFRLGYVAGPKELISAMQNAIHYVTLCPPHISQLVALEALKIHPKYVDTMVNEYDRRRRFIVKRLNEMDLKTQMPGGAFYAFAQTKGYAKNSLKFTEDLLKKAKVATVPGTEFGSFGEGYTRFSYATKMKNIKIAMQRLEKFLKKR
jgi:aminotransferase